MAEALVNRGIAVVGSPAQEKMPIIVCGVARGGTSMIAGALAELGVFMGDQAAPPVFEDTLLASAMETSNFTTALSIASKYSADHGRWGWKRPSSINYLDKVDNVFGEVAYIFVYKDIFSIAKRNAISMLEEILPMMQMSLDQYGKSLDFLNKKHPYAMLVSYDKAVAYPEHFIEKLVEFCQLTPSEAQKKRSIDFITPEPMNYLEESRIMRTQGCLDGMSGRLIFGWAKYVFKKAPPIVDILLNDVVVGTVVADSSRPDIDEKLGVPCAFFFDLPNNILLKQGDRLRARVQDEIRDLKGSDFEVTV